MSNQHGSFPAFTADSMANGATGQSREVTDRTYSCLLDELVGDNVNVCDLVSENPRIYDILRRWVEVIPNGELVNITCFRIGHRVA